jgi:anti-sigma factor RsiW
VIQEPVRCREMVDVVTDWMEGALDETQRAAVEGHLSICPDCIAYVDQLRTATALAAQLAEADAAEAAPVDLKARLLAAFRSSRPG